MKRAGWPIAVMILASLIEPGLAEAQALGGLRVGADLLSHPVVRKELKLDATQLEKAKALSLELRGRQNLLIAQLEGLEGEARTAKVRELADVLSEEETKGLTDLLRPDQLARFRQVELQERGASGWLDSKIAGELALTPEQTENLKKRLDRSIIERREAQSNTRGNRRATFDKLQALRKAVDADAFALLTSEQQETWKRMIGEPLDLNPPLTRASR